MADDFDRWLRTAFVQTDAGIRHRPTTVDMSQTIGIGQEAGDVLSPEQVFRLIVHLASLAGPPAPGLSPEELEAIRGRASAEKKRIDGLGYVSSSGPHRQRLKDVFDLLRDHDSQALALVTLAAEVEGLNHVIACMKEDG